MLSHINRKTDANVRLSDIIQIKTGKEGKTFKVTVPENKVGAVLTIWAPTVSADVWRKKAFRDAAAQSTDSRGPRPQAQHGQSAGPRPHMQQRSNTNTSYEQWPAYWADRNEYYQHTGPRAEDRGFQQWRDPMSESAKFYYWPDHRTGGNRYHQASRPSVRRWEDECYGPAYSNYRF